MSRRCDICGKGAQKAVSRSHSNIATKRKQFSNLQARHIDGQKKKVCTSCLKTLVKKAA